MSEARQTLEALLAELRRLQAERAEYERDDALEGVIDCNRELSAKRLEIKQHCAEHELPVPGEL